MALDDVEAAYRFVVTPMGLEAQYPGCINLNRLVLAGDSAGGNLSGALMVRLHRSTDRLPHQLLPNLLVLIYPALDLTCTASSCVIYEEGYHLTMRSARWFLRLYLNGKQDDPSVTKDPEASPLFAPDYTIFPSTLIIAAEHDILHDDGVLFTEKMRKAGRAVNYVKYPGLVHGFMFMLGLIPEAKLAVDEVAKAVSQLP